MHILIIFIVYMIISIVCSIISASAFLTSPYRRHVSVLRSKTVACNLHMELFEFKQCSFPYKLLDLSTKPVGACTRIVRSVQYEVWHCNFNGLFDCQPTPTDYSAHSTRVPVKLNPTNIFQKILLMHRRVLREPVCSLLNLFFKSALQML